jgi:hypothetical protein
MWFIGCKRAVRYRRKRAPKTVVSRLQEGSLVLTQEGVKTVVYRLQEGANNVGYRLQEGSPATAQVGAKHRGF